MAIKKLSDLKMNQEYFVVLVENGKASKALLCGIVNEFPNVKETELYLRFVKPNPVVTGIYRADTIGIGETPEEAKENYGAFTYEDHPGFFTSLDALKEHLGKDL